MGYFDDNEETEKEGISALAEGLNAKEEKAAEKERRKEEKRLEKERRKKEKEALKRGEPLPEEEEIKTRITPEDTVVEPVKSKRQEAREAKETVEAAAGEAVQEAKEASGTETVAALSAEKEEAEEETSGRKKKKKKKQKEKPEDVNIVKDLLSLIIYIGIVIVICFLIVTFVGRRTTVHGDSMNPTLESGDSLWINMLAYKFGDPERFDIIVFPYQDDVHYIKRIIGLPGETIQITEGGEILINGKVLDEPIKFERMRNNGIASTPITLGENEYFVLGDNRNNSRDSRWADVGLIKRDKIVGKAVFRLTPFKKFGSIK